MDVESLSSQSVTSEYKESTGQRTLLSTMLTFVEPRYKLADGVTEEDCKLFLATTREFFKALAFMDKSPVIAFLGMLADARTEKSCAQRTIIVASLMRPFEDRIRAHDTSVITGDKNSIVSSFTPMANEVVRAFWNRTSVPNRTVLWEWIELIVDKVSDLTDPL